MNIEELILEKRYEEIFFSSDHNVNWKFTDVFYENFTKNNKGECKRIIKFMQKTFNAPESGKMLHANRKGQREHKTYTRRFYYYYSKKDNLIIFLEYSKKKLQKKNPFEFYEFELNT